METFTILDFSWDSTNGAWKIYVDGQLTDSGTGLSTGSPVGAGGTLLFGQEQDIVQGNFDPTQIFQGTFYNARIFSDIRTDQEILDNYNNQLNHSEQGLVANWDFDNLSSDGIITESVSGNNLTARNYDRPAFNESKPELVISVSENSVSGTEVATLLAYDIERSAKISQLLASDPDLYYDEVTGKFYKVVSSTAVFSTAQSNAQAATLGGVSGDLVTIGSAHENQFVLELAKKAGGNIWLSGGDSDVEGQWYWTQGGQLVQKFWSGDASGSSPDGVYVNWNGGEPNDSAGEDHIEMRFGDGTWNDNGASTNNRSVIQWDADAVLDATDAITYSIVSQSVPGAFSIDSDTGKLVIADGSKIDYESQASHSVTVRVTDVDGNITDKTFQIAVEDRTEPSNNNLSVSAGIQLNNDGGNDSYLIADSGDSVFGSRQAFTIEISFIPTGNLHGEALLSYASASQSNEIRVYFDHSGNLDLQIENDYETTSISAGDFTTGQLYNLSFTWDNGDGDWAVYIDGVLRESGNHLSENTTIDSGGTLIFGQEQDSQGGGFENDEMFHGVLYDVRVWDHARTSAQVNAYLGQKIPSSGLPSGLVANWQMDGFNGSGEVVDVVSGNNLSVGHAAGSGFTSSTPSYGFTISEGIANGTVIGKVYGSGQGGFSDNTVNDGNFTLEGNTGPGGHKHFDATETFGGWTVRSGSVDLIEDDHEFSPTGGWSVDLNHNEPGGIYQTLTTVPGTEYQISFAFSGRWDGGESQKDLRVTAAGVTKEFSITQPSDWSTSNMQWEHRTFTFTADSTTTVLDFLSLDAGDRGPVIADVQVVAIPAAVQAVLNLDPTLKYNAGTGKFYKHVSSATSWTQARTDSIASQLNGVSGELAVVGSAYENDLLHQWILGIGDVWLGGSDTDSEGTWKWYNGASAGDTFWTGAGGGSASGGAWTNFDPGEPDASTASADFLVLKQETGLWRDSQEAYHKGYMIQWDANEVVSKLSYSLSDDADGAFSINSQTGEITVADTTRLDYETGSTETITVRYADVGGNFAESTVTININDDADDPGQTTPESVSFGEGSSVTFNAANSNQITVNAPGGGSEVLRVDLSVPSGSLTLSTTSGITFLSGSNGSGSMQIFGTQNALNAALNDLIFSPPVNFNGEVEIEMTTSLQDGLVGHYTFDGGSGTDESYGTQQNGSFGADAHITPEPSRGNVLELDGDLDRFTIASQFGNPANVTLAAWVNVTSAGDLISMGDNLAIRLQSDDSIQAFYYTGSTWLSFAVANTGVLNGGWVHVALTFDDVANSQKLFVNGTEVGSASHSSSIVYGLGTETRIGIHGNNSSTYDVAGKFDDIRIYEKALTASEIQSLVSGNVATSSTITVNVTPANDAPNLLTSGNLTLPTISENDILNLGSSVADIIASDGGDRITDIDGDPEGIAVFSLTSTHGTWQFSVDSGSSWTDVGAVSSGSSLLLRSTDYLRFVPDGDNGETASFDFRAWDQTAGTYGTKVDTSSNGGLSAFSYLTNSASITVTDLNSAPTDISPGASSVDENVDASSGISVATLSTTDSDVGDTFTYSIVGGADAGKFSIGGSGNDELIFTESSVDYETKSSYSVQVQVTDSGGATFQKTITVNVNDVNEAATVAWNGSYISGFTEMTVLSNYKVGELQVTDDALGTNTLSVTGADASKFEIIGNEVFLKAGAVLDYETQSSLNVTINVDDASIGGGVDHSFNYTLNLADVDEFDVSAISDSQSSVTNQVIDDATVGTTVGYTAFAADADGTTNTVTYSLSNNDGGRFSIDANTGVVTLAQTVDRQTDGDVRTITVVATSADGSSSSTNVDIHIVSAGGVPIHDVPGGQVVNEDSDITFSSSNGNAVTVISPGSASDLLEVRLSVENGNLTLSQLTGLTVVSGANGTGEIVIQGAEADINAALEGLIFSPDSNFSGNVDLQIQSHSLSDLVGHYKFDGNADNSGTQGSSHDGSLVGNAGFVQDPSRGQVLQLDGTGDFVDVNGTYYGNPQNITLSVWVNVDADNAGGAEFISLGEDVWLILNGGGSNSLMGIFSDGAQYQITQGTLTADEPIEGTGWRHIAYTFDDVNNVQKLYLDGTLIGQTTYSESIDYYTLNKIRFGGYAQGGNEAYSTDGKLDDARIYSRALSAAEITKLAADTFQTSSTISITVSDQNDAPTGGDNTISISEDSLYRFQPSDFGYSDIDGDALDHITIQSLPGQGSLKLNGTLVTLNQDISLADLQNGRLTFEPADGEFGNSYDSFTFTVNDGTVDSVATSAVTFHVDSVNDAPIFYATDGTGIVLTDVGGVDVSTSMTQTPDGKIIAVGYVQGGVNADLAIIRFNADGSLDTTFGGGDGIVRSDLLGSDEHLFGVTVQSDGKILVAGNSGSSATDYLVARFNEDGTLDSTFGAASGYALVNIAGASDYELARDIHVASDGSIYLVGWHQTGGNIATGIIKFTSSGILDSSFGSGMGTVELANSPFGVNYAESFHLNGDGSFYVFGRDGSDLTVSKFSAAGILDTSFSSDGIAEVDFTGGVDQGGMGLVQTDGKIVIVGHVGGDARVARLNTDGSLDGSFGIGGKASIDLAGGADLVTSAQIQSDGKIVLVGHTTINSTTYASVMRFNVDGTIDSSFGQGSGYVLVETTGTSTQATDVSIGSDGKILVSASADLGGTNQFAIIRLNSNGSLDQSFGASSSYQNTVSYTEGQTNIPLNSSVQISDQDLDALNAGSGNYDGATVVLGRTGGVNAEDIFSFIDGNGYSLSGSEIQIGGVTIASFVINSPSGQLSIQFTDANGTIPTTSDVQAILRQIGYSNSNQNPSGSIQIGWTINDGNTSSQGTGGALEGTYTTTVNLTGTNDAPVLDNSGTLTLDSITEDDISNSGNTVAEVLASSGVDRTSDFENDPDGIAIYQLTSSNGTWQYSVDGGSNWNDVGTVSASSSLLLSSSDLVRFVPDQENADVASFDFRLWDQTSGSVGTKVDSSVNGGTTAFSSAAETASITVTAVNDAPTMPATQTFNLNEGTDTSGGHLLGNLLAQDVDSGDSLTYTLVGGPDQSRFTISNSSTGELRFNDGVLDYEGQSSYSVVVRATDSNGSFVNQTVTLSVVNQNDAPTISIGSPTVAATENLDTSSRVFLTTVSVIDDSVGTNNVTLSGADASFFEVDGGMLYLKSGVNLDYESKSQYQVTINVDDPAVGADPDDSVVFTLNLNDQDEFDVSAISDTDSATNAVDENASVGTVVGMTAFASDADGTNNTVSYSLSDDAGGLFAIDSSTGVVTVAGSLDFETDSNHTIEVTATSSDGSSSVQTFNISVNDLDEFDVSAVSDSDASTNTVTEAATIGTSVGIIAFASDADGTTNSVSYTLSDDAGGRFAINSSTGEVTVAAALDFEVATGHTIEVTATSADGSVSTQNFSIAVTDVDEFDVSAITNSVTHHPIAEDSAIGNFAGIIASASDADGSNNAITYSLTDDAGGLFAINASTGVVTVAGALDYETATNHSIEVTATSADGSSSVQTFAVNIADRDEFDVSAISDSDAGQNTVSESASVGTSVGLIALASDADGTNNTITYSLSDDAGGRFTINASTGEVTVASALDYESAISHTIEVTASSSDGSSSTQSFTISVTDEDEFDVSPITDSDSSANSVNENVAIGTSVGIIATANDADGTNNTVTYTLSDNAGGRFGINSSTGEVIVANALDYESATNHTIEVTATSSDGSSSVQSFLININDLDEFDVSPISDSDGNANSVSETATIGTSVGIIASASDADGTNNTVSYSLSDDAGGRFAINSSTGEVTVAGALDYESATSHNIEVTATSSDGSSSTQTFAISVSDEDEFDVSAITDTNVAGNSVDENVAVGTSVGIIASASDADGTNNTITYSLSNDAGGLFTIDSNTGEVTVAGAVDFETSSSHTIEVTATSSDGSSSVQNFSIAVNDLDEFDVSPITDTDSSNNTVSESSSVGTSVGIVAHAFDGDGSNSTVTYSLSDSAGGLFAINSASGEVTVASALDFETATGHTIEVTATSSDGSSSTQTFSISVSDEDEFDVSPVVDADGDANQVDENATIGTTVGIIASAFDADGSQNTVSFSLSDDSGGRFAINSSTGEVTVASTIDFEIASSHTIEVTATSSDGSSSVQTFTISVNDLDEFDVSSIVDTDVALDSVSESAAIGTSVGITAFASDPDGSNSTVSYSLSNDAGGRFTIDSTTGEVTVASALDYESATNHVIEVTATSTDGSTSTQTYNIAVNDEDEFDVSSINDTDAGANQVDENSSIGSTVGIVANAIDADGSNNTVTYSLSNDAGGRFAIDASTGVVTVAGSLDYEANSSHTIEVTASSTDGSSSVQTYSIAVVDVDEFDVSPVSDTDGAANVLSESASAGTSVGITAFANDADGTNNTVTYSLSDDDGGRFTIDSNTGEVTLATSLDYESAVSHQIEVTATSSDGSSSTQTYTIAVTDEDEFDVSPVIDTDGNSNDVDENTAIGSSVGIIASAFDGDGSNNTITYSLSDDAGGLFTIDGNTGEVTVNGSIDYESATSHTIEVTAASSDGSSSVQTFTIAVNDLDEFDVSPISDSDSSIDTVAEGVSVGTSVGIVAFASDADGSNNFVSYHLSDDAGGLFTIDPNSGEVTVAAGLDYETATSHNIEVTATSADGSSSVRVFNIVVTDDDEFDVSPIVDSDNQTNQVNEHASVGDQVGLTANAFDADGTNNVVSYQLTDDAGGRFAVDSNTGVVTVAGALDFEVSQSHTIEIQATSSDGSSSLRTFTIIVVDQNDNPTDIGLTGNSVDENSSAGQIVGTLNTTDQDSWDSHNYQIISGNDGDAFAIDSAGRIVVNQNVLNYEDQDTYHLTVRSTDQAGQFIDRVFQIDVRDVNDRPVGEHSIVNTLEDQSFSGSVMTSGTTDEDGDGMTVQLISGPSNAASFSLDSDGSFEYSPEPDYHGQETFSFVLFDGQSYSDLMTVTINVGAVNDAPVSEGESFEVNQGATLDVADSSILENDLDVDGDSLIATLVDHPQHGTIVFNQDGTFSYQPNPTYFGQDHFTYVLNDGTVDGNVVQVTLDIKPVDFGSDNEPDSGSGSSSEEENTNDGQDDSSTDSDLDDEENQQDAADVTETNDNSEENTKEDSSGSPETLLGPFAKKTENSGSDRDEGRVSDFGDADASARDSLIREARFNAESMASKLLSGNIDARDITLEQQEVILQNHAISTWFFDSSIVWQDSTTDSTDGEQQVEMKERLIQGSILTGSLMATAGYFLWTLRGGILMATFMSSMPNWRFIDPLPIVDSFNDQTEDIAGEVGLQEMLGESET